MDDLISRQAAWEITAKLHSEFITIEQEEILERIDEMIEQLPSAQPEIIRCKECSRWCICHRSDDWYCADAERIKDGSDR